MNERILCYCLQGTTPRNEYFERKLYNVRDRICKMVSNWFCASDIISFIYLEKSNFISLFIFFQGVVDFEFRQKRRRGRGSPRFSSRSKKLASRSFLGSGLLGRLVKLQELVFDRENSKCRNDENKSAHSQRKVGLRGYKIPAASQHSSLGRHFSVSIQVTIMQSLVSSPKNAITFQKNKKN